MFRFSCFGNLWNGKKKNLPRRSNRYRKLNVEELETRQLLSADGAGNTLATARNLGSLANSLSVSDYVGAADTNDYYQFNIAARSNLHIQLSGLTADADLQLLSSGGSVLGYSNHSGTANETIDATLAAGSYYARVYPYGSVNTNYALSLGATPVIVTPQSPTNVTASDGLYTDRVSISWSAPTGATAYEVWRSTSNNSGTAVKVNPSDVTGTSYNDTTAQPGTTYWYWIKAKNSAGTSGFSGADSGSRHVVGPANDNFVNRTILSGMSATFTGTNVNAAKETGEPSHAGNGGGKSIWLSWTAPTTGSVQIDTMGSNFDTLLSVYTGSNLTSLSKITADDDGGGNATSKVTFNTVAGMTYQIAVDGYNGATGNITLHLSAVAADPNDQISEAINPTGLLSSTSPVVWAGQSIGSPTDVNMYSFRALANEKLAFNIDRPAGGTFDSYIRLFDANGAQLAYNDDAAAPGGSYGAASYLEYRFASAGTYYLGVSGYGNGNYNALTGSGDTNGSTGAYSLTIRDLHSIVSQVSGVSLSGTAKQIPITLTRADNATAAIDPTLQTWIVIHGRNGSSNDDNFTALAAAVAHARPGEQVLLLDWSQGANDNSSLLFNLAEITGLPVAAKVYGMEGARWIEPVAITLARILQAEGFRADHINLIGHSWGAHVAGETARWMGSPVRSLVALDPAVLITNYHGFQDYTGADPNFGANSQWSWAFNSSSLGLNYYATTARESFNVSLVNDLSPLSAHSDVVRLFTNLIANNTQSTVDSISSLFSLNRLVAHTGTTSPWQIDDRRQSLTTFNNTGFEASLMAANIDGNWEPLSLAYTDARRGDRQVIQSGLDLGTFSGTRTTRSQTGTAANIAFYRFSVTSMESVSVQLSGLTGVDVTLASADGLTQYTTTVNDARSAVLSRWLSKPGTWYVIVTPRISSIGSYTLSVTG